MKLPTKKWINDFVKKNFRGYQIVGAGQVELIYKKKKKPK